MAIGDKPNQNLFGTDYNAEGEEEKKARLAAQDAMMGANVPAAAFGQAPAVNPFSMEAAGQVNSMMEQQSLAVPPQAPATFLPYADDVAPPPASALSVFTPGGEVKPNVDVNAITPSPEMTSTSAVNTPLNQEVAVGPTSNEPGFLYNTFVNAPVKADQIATEFMSNLGNKISTGYDNLLGSAMRNLTPAEDRRFANNEPFGKTFTDTFAITRPDGTKFYPDEVTSSAGATQAPSEASALGATPSVTLPVETPSEGAQEQVMDVNQSDIANAQGQEATQGGATAPPPAQTLSQFMRYEDSPEQRTEQFVDEQGRLRFRPTQEALRLQAQGEVTQPPVDALSSFEQDSLARQQRIGGTGSFEGDSEARETRLRANERQLGESQADRDTRVAQSRTTGGQAGGLSFDDARRRAEGELAERGVRNPSASQVNALARLKQVEEPERLAKLETQRALDEATLRQTNTKMGFEPRLIDVGGERAMELSPGYFQRIAKDKPNKTGLQATLDSLQDDLTSGRLTQEQHDIAVANATNIYIGLKEPKQNEIDVSNKIAKLQEEAMGTTPAEGDDASDVKSYATEAEARASGVKGEVLIGGRRAIIE